MDPLALLTEAHLLWLDGKETQKKRRGRKNVCESPVRFGGCACYTFTSTWPIYFMSLHSLSEGKTAACSQHLELNVLKGMSFGWRRWKKKGFLVYLRTTDVDVKFSRAINFFSHFLFLFTEFSSGGAAFSTRGELKCSHKIWFADLCIWNLWDRLALDILNLFLSFFF